VAARKLNDNVMNQVHHGQPHDTPDDWNETDPI